MNRLAGSEDFWSNIQPVFLEKAFFEGFVGENFTQDDFLDLARMFGKPLRTKHFSLADGLIQRVADDGLFDNQDVHWHNDYSYSTGNFFGTALLCEYDETHCPTTFADMNLLLRFLNQEEIQLLKQTLSSFAPPEQLKSCFTKMQWQRIERENITRPLIQRDLVTNSECIYCSPATLVGDFKQTALYNKIIQLAESHCFNIHWKPKKIVIYDNYRYMHKRGSFSGKRALLRIQFNYDNLSKRIPPFP